MIYKAFTVIRNLLFKFQNKLSGLNHWKPIVVMIPKLLALVSRQIVTATTSVATNDDKVDILAFSIVVVILLIGDVLKQISQDLHVPDLAQQTAGAAKTLWLHYPIALAPTQPSEMMIAAWP